MIRPLLHDRHFIIALAIGPACWLLLWQTGVIEASSTPLPATRLLLLIGLYPLLEELLFRGVIQPWLHQRLGNYHDYLGITRANLLTSLFFSLSHLVNQPPLWAASVFIPSLLFGYFRDRYRGVLPGSLLHIWYNAGFFLLVRGG